MFAHRLANAFGHYLEVVDYGTVDAMLVIPKGMEGKGWKSHAMELKFALFLPTPEHKALGKVLHLDKSVDKRKEQGKLVLSYAEVA